jgi:hypothetical protein
MSLGGLVPSISILQPLSKAPGVDRFDQLRKKAIAQQNSRQPNERAKGA